MPNSNQLEVTRERRIARMWHNYLPAAGTAAAHSLVLRAVLRQDVPAIAAISHPAFAGGPDAASEPELLQKLAAIVDGRYGRLIDAASLVHESRFGVADAAILVTDCMAYDGPVIAFVVVEKAMQQRGMASALLSQSLSVLQQLGHSQCCARITQGNMASERLFFGCGFR